MGNISIGERLRIPTYDNEAHITLGNIVVDEEKCNGCGTCAVVCPGKAIYIEGIGKNKKAKMEPVFPQCMACNDCAAICEKDAIRTTQGCEFTMYYKTIDRGELLGPRTF